MMQPKLDYTHPVFRDFKHLKLSGDCAISFEPGTGGNFLITCVTENNFSSDGAIDFPNAQKVHLACDGNFDQNQNGFDIDYSVIYRNASLIDTSGTNKIFSSHSLPLITSHVFTFEVPYIIMLDSAPGDRWLPQCLSFYKNTFSDDYGSKPYMLGILIQNNPYNGPISMQEYTALMSTFKEKFDNITFDNSPITWKYYCHCKHEQLDMFNMINWSDYLLRWIAGQQEICRFYDHAWFRTAARNLKERGYRLVPIDYVDLFFNLEIPDLPFFELISRDMLVDYSRKNMQALTTLISMLGPRHSSGFKRRIDALVKMLDNNR